MNNHHIQSRFRLGALALAIASSTGIAAPALAQEQRAAGLEEIIVTAQRREESLQDTPIAITAFTANQLEDLGAFDVTRIGNFAPNVTIEKQPGANSNMGVRIRGFGEGETSLLANPKVGVYIDGVYMSKTVGGVFDIVDMDRIEILRGPQGTLFGKNTVGGAMNVTTRKPAGVFDARLHGSVGSDGYTRYGGSIDTPEVANIAAKFSYMHMESDGWATNDYQGTPTQPAGNVEHDLASDDNTAYRIALRWTPREDLTVDYAYDNTDNAGVAIPFQIVKVHDKLYDYKGGQSPFPYEVYGGPLYQQMAATVGDPTKRRKHYTLDAQTDNTLDVDGHTLVAEWQATESLALKYIFGKRKTEESTSGTDLDGGAYLARDLFYGVFAGNNNPVPTPGFHGSIPKNSQDAESHELQLTGTALNDKLKFTGGLFYHDEDVMEDNRSTYSLPIAFLAPAGASSPGLGPLYDAAGFCPPAFGGFLCVGTQRLPVPGAGDPYAAGLNDLLYGQTTESRAAYGQGTYSITEQLDLTLGIRYTEDEKDAFLYNQGIAGYTKDAPITTSDKWSDTNYLANLNYAITDDTRVYLSYSTGYNSGGFNARASNVGAFQTPFDKEQVEMWELGLKSQFLDNRVRLNAALFTNDYTDIQVAQFEAGSGGASSKIVNAGKGTYEGFEIELTMIPVDGLTLDLSYGYLDAVYDEYLALNPATNQLEDISEFTKASMAPKNTGSLGIQYDFEPMSFGQISARMDVSYKDEMVFHPYQNLYDSAEDRTLLDARISLNDIPLGENQGSLRVSLWGKNLTDEEYRSWGIDFGALGFAGDTFGDPLSYGLDVVYQYK